MDYEKKYKDALGWMRSVYPTLSGAAKEDAEYYFPELKESEDERIRKWIKKELESKYVVDNIVNNTMADKALAYLEKQKEQKPAEWSEEDEKRFDSCMGRLLTPDGAPTINSCWFEDHCNKHPHWKPSEEQMDALKYALGKGGSYNKEALDSLLIDLQKLL